MDQLDVLKKEWQSREHEYPQLTYGNIHQMLLKKSSSMVKWIFFISIGELLLWTLLAFLVPESSKQITAEMGLKTIFFVINAINYSVFAIFIYLFYKNYKAITVTDTVKDLMAKILKTRRTVRHFVMYNIGAAALLMVGVNIFYYLNKDKLFEVLQQQELYSAIPAETFATSFFIAQFIVGVLLIGFLLLFYWLVYGILLRRLKRNYKELKKIEV